MKSCNLENLIQYYPKSKRKANDGLENGIYPFFTSSQNQNKFLNEFDYSDECIILGTGGAPSIHIAKQFATSADVFIINSINQKII